MPSNGQIVIELPATYTVAAGTATAVSGIADGTLTTSFLVNVITIARTAGTTSVAALSTVSFTLTGATNPSSSGATGSFAQLFTADSVGTQIDPAGVLPTSLYILGLLTSITTASSTLVGGAATTLTFTFTLATSLQITGKIVIQFPSGYTLGTIVCVSTAAALDGTLTVSKSGQIVTITRSGGSVVTPQAISFTLTGATNPTTAGATGAFVQLKTQLARESTPTLQTEMPWDLLSRPRPYCQIWRQ